VRQNSQAQAGILLLSPSQAISAPTGTHGVEGGACSALGCSIGNPKSQKEIR